MARQQTAAPERRAQDHRLVEEVSAELGRPVTIVEARAHRKAKRAGSDPRTAYIHKLQDQMRQIVDDRGVEFRPDELRFLGKFIAKVGDMRLMGGETIQSFISAPADFSHLFVDLHRLSKAHTVLFVAYEIFPESDHGGDS